MAAFLFRVCGGGVFFPSNVRLIEQNAEEIEWNTQDFNFMIYRYYELLNRKCSRFFSRARSRAWEEHTLNEKKCM